MVRGMKVIVVGLPEREAFAISLLMSKLLPDWGYRSQSIASSDGSGDLYVLDVDAWQETHGRQDVTAGLKAMLNAKPAVLLTSPLAQSPEARLQAQANERDWQACGWVVLHRPYRASAMQEALQRAEQRPEQRPDAVLKELDDRPAVKSTATATATAPVDRDVATKTSAPRPLLGVPLPLLGSPVPPPGGRSGTSSSSGGGDAGVSFFSAGFFTTTVQGVSASPAHTGNSGMPPPDITDDELTLAAFAACLPSSPSAECRQFLGALADRLAQPGAFEMSFTMINGVLFDGAAQWVATNTPISLLRMVARSRTLGAYVKTTDLEAQVDPTTRSAQRGMKEYPLGAFLHALARMADCRLPKEG